jgi:hypothetical protein
LAHGVDNNCGEVQLIEWFIDNLYIILPSILLYSIFGFGAATSVHWLRRRLNFTGLYAWSGIITLLLVERLYASSEEILSHGTERVLTLALVFATLLSLLFSQTSEEKFAKIIGREHLNEKPQKYGSLLWWLIVITTCGILSILTIEFPTWSLAIIDLFDPSKRGLR